ncbi:EamA family transporter [Nocardioides sp. Kera G14]|uniref:EamA family transporter n=1 Tax=Nocardioides sp. Kera G14 TaxID=2884264 RepID=UPI001D11F3FB|nr:EamA family transporter [Nocardioides sp. Kera G14]UDY23708.1 DMT family transporter [Nocardioides sp. Kera G14]
MSPAILLLVLGSAVLHATWNAIAHGSRDRLVNMALVESTFVVIPAIAICLTGLPDSDAWPFIIASGITHTCYMLTLLTSFRLGEFSQVYPLARGTSPWVVALISLTLLHQHLPALQVLGVIVVSAGLLLLVMLGGVPTRHHVPAIAAAVGTGLLIATYTVIDGEGVQRTEPLTYMAWSFLAQGPWLMGWLLATRRRAAITQIRQQWWAGILGGVVSMVAYGTVIWAQSKGHHLAPIAALRETSIVFGALIGALFFGERLGWGRAVSAAVVVAGIALLAV